MKATTVTESKPPKKKRLSFAQSVDAACILFRINTRPQGILRLGNSAALPSQYTEGSSVPKLLQEWTAFVHAAVTTGLMVHAPNSVLVEYLRQTRQLLNLHDTLDEAAVNHFIDDAFSAYLERMAQERQQRCPELFFQRLLGTPMQNAPQKSCAVIAGTMALTISAIWDKLDQYDFAIE